MDGNEPPKPKRVRSAAGAKVEKRQTIKSVKKEEKQEKEGVIHKGISKRHFVRSFTVADDVEVKGAELKDGLLTVALERIIPEAKKPRTIKIK